jgi:hypothetical protein
MVAGTRRNDTVGPLLVAEASDAHVCTANLERARSLKVFALEGDRATDLFRQRT